MKKHDVSINDLVWTNKGGPQEMHRGYKYYEIV